MPDLNGKRDPPDEVSCLKLVELMPAAVYTCDAEGRLTFYNCRAAELWGREPQLGDDHEKFCGSFRMWTPEGAPVMHDQCPMADAVREGRSARNMEVVVEHPTGSRVVVSVNIDPLYDDQGRLVGAINVFEDVTARKRQEAALRDSEERLRIALQAARMGIWIWYINRDVHRRDANLNALLGLPTVETEEAFPKFLEHIHPDDRDLVAREFERSVKNGHNLNIEFRTVWPDGTIHWLRDQGDVFGQGDGRYMSGACLDITERKQLEGELRQADRRKDEFLAILAHELRNPLAPIRNTLHILKSTDGEQLHQAINMMDEQVDHVVRLVDDLLDVSRIGRGKIDLQKKNLDVVEVARRAVEQVQPLLSQRELMISAPGRPIYVDADPVRLLQIIGNLLHNATKFTEVGGNVWLTIERSGKEVVIRVRDDGIGIAETQSQRIFEMFAQGDTSIGRTQGGLGVGLTLVKNLVEMHGGVVEVYSEGVGLGSEFVVRLPIAETPPKPIVPVAADHEGGRPASPSGGAPAKVLVVDDIKMAADTLAMMLKLAGYEVHTRYDGEDAVAAAASLRPDLVILDVGMPKMNGYEACQAIREKPWGRDMAVVALTGWGQESDIQHTRDAGFDAHVVKPPNAVELKELLRTLLLGRRGNATP